MFYLIVNLILLIFQIDLKIELNGLKEQIELEKNNLKAKCTDLHNLQMEVTKQQELLEVERKQKRDMVTALRQRGEKISKLSKQMEMINFDIKYKNFFAC